MELDSSVNSERVSVRSSARSEWVCLTHCSRFYEEVSLVDVSVVSPKMEMAILWLACHVIMLKPCSAPLVAQLVKNPPAMQETWVQSLGWEDPWKREQLPTPVFWPGEFQESSRDCIVHGVTKSRTRLSDFHYRKHALGENVVRKETKRRKWHVFKIWSSIFCQWQFLTSELLKHHWGIKTAKQDTFLFKF